MFEPYPKKEPNFKSVYYLVIVKRLNTYSYAFRYFNDDCEFETESQSETICAFSQVAPIEVMMNIDRDPKTVENVAKNA